jgi:hypothetical protein
MLLAKRIIFWTSISLLFAFVALSLTSIEFTESHTQTSFEEFRLVCLPLAILLTLFGTLKKTDSRAEHVGLLGITILISTVSFVVLHITSMCSWTQDRTLFKNKNSPDKRIVLREYGCGAYDSGEPAPIVVEVKDINTFLCSVTRFDTSSLNAEVWGKTD